MNIQYIEPESIVNGEGSRCVVWVSGCGLHCAGCHNPETWDPQGGRPFTYEDMEQIIKILKNPYIRGVTFSGGDPLYNYEHIVEVGLIIDIIKRTCPDKTIWLYTGQKWEDIKYFDLFKQVDVLVDGPFIMELLDVNYPWAGSTNQRVIDVQESLKQDKVILWEGQRG